jgi:SAM-dependent MidA family methyltransferase
MSKEKQKENRGFVITIDYGHLAETFILNKDIEGR